jgi:hypothetical protein
MPRARDLNRHVASETAYDFQDLRCFFLDHVFKGPPLVTTAYHGREKKPNTLKTHVTSTFSRTHLHTQESHCFPSALPSTNHVDPSTHLTAIPANYPPATPLNRTVQHQQTHETLRKPGTTSITPHMQPERNSTAQAKDFDASMERLQKNMMHAFQNNMAILQGDVSGLRRDMSSLQSDTTQVRIKLMDVSSAVTILKAQAEEEAKKKAREEAKKEDARDWYWIYAVR